MPKFKVAVSKNQKRYTLIFNSENEKQVRERVHKEGYSILNLEVISNEAVLGKKFKFKAEYKGEVKEGRVVGEDIFKIYVKLRKDLGYRVLFIYPEEEVNITDEYKNKLIKELDEEYEIYFKNIKIKTKKTVKKKEVNNNEAANKNIENFYLKKELDETYKLINFVLEKLVNLIDGKEIENLDILQKEKLKSIYNSIVKLKKTTNISKLKEVGELALLKIGKLELADIELDKDKKNKDLLVETNRLLKKMGSSRQFIEKNKDIKYILNTFLTSFQEYFTLLFTFKPQKKSNKIDKHSHTYIKTELLIKKYKERLHLNTKYLIQHFYLILFPFINPNKRSDLFLKRKVILQNITLLNAKKKNGVSFSFTSVTKGSQKLVKSIYNLLENIRTIVFGISILYSFIFIGYLVFGLENPSFQFDYSGLFYSIVVLLYYVIFYFKLNYINLFVNLIGICINFAFLYFILIFGVVNF